MTSNRLILSVLFQVFSISLFAQLSQQQLDANVESYAKNLRQKGIDTFCIYNEYCIGCIFKPAKGGNLCAENFSSLPTYIFWRDKGKTYVTRKDICFDYSIQQLPNDSFWYYYFAHREKIKKEELKTPQYIEIVDGKKETRTINIDQSIYFRLTLIAGKSSVTKNINSFFFTRELGTGDELNINYEFNMSTSLNKLHSTLQGIVKQELFQRKFIRTLR